MLSVPTRARVARERAKPLAFKLRAMTPKSLPRGLRWLCQGAATFFFDLTNREIGEALEGWLE